MAIAVVDSFGNFNAAGTLSYALPVSGIQVGDMLVVASYAFSNTASLVLDDPVDDGGNTYAEHCESLHDATFRTWCSLSSTIVVTPPTEVTIAVNTSTAELSAAVLRCTDADPADRFEAADANEQTSGTPTSDSVAGVLGGLAVAAITQDASASYTSVAGGWTIAEKVESSGWTDFAIAYLELSSSTTYQAAWTVGGAADYGMGIATFNPASVGPDTGLAWIRA